MTVARLLLWAATAAVAVVVPVSPAAADGQSEPLVNRGFEDGLTGWTCESGRVAVVTRPVYAGSRALAGAGNASCSQTMEVGPDITYRFTAWVRGRNVQMGVVGHSPASKRGGRNWYPLQFTFRAGPDQRTAEFFFAGTKGRPYVIDKISIEGVCPPEDPDNPTPCPSLFWP